MLSARDSMGGGQPRCPPGSIKCVSEGASGGNLGGNQRHRRQRPALPSTPSTPPTSRHLLPHALYRHPHRHLPPAPRPYWLARAADTIISTLRAARLWAVPHSGAGAMRGGRAAATAQRPRRRPNGRRRPRGRAAAGAARRLRGWPAVRKCSGGPGDRGRMATRWPPRGPRGLVCNWKRPSSGRLHATCAPR